MAYKHSQAICHNLSRCLWARLCCFFTLAPQNLRNEPAIQIGTTKPIPLSFALSFFSSSGSSMEYLGFLAAEAADRLTQPQRASQGLGGGRAPRGGTPGYGHGGRKGADGRSSP